GWRRDRLLYTFGSQLDPTVAERAGDYSGICPGDDCPTDPLNNDNPFPGNQVPVNPSDPNIQRLLSMIPLPTSGRTYSATISQPTNWRQELIRVDHDLSDKEHLVFRYIHDSWETLNPNPLWTNQRSFPTVQRQFTGPH